MAGNSITFPRIFLHFFMKILTFVSIKNKLFLEPISPVVMTVDINQYSPDDHYGDDHPIFNKTTIAQLYISMSESDLGKGIFEVM